MTELAIRELVDEIDGRLLLSSMPPLGGDAEPVGQIVIDSREIQPGDLFWALAGTRANGSDFAEDAFARGAAGVVVGDRHVEPWAGRFTIQVKDTRLALWQLAAAIRYRFKGTVTAVTGSVGKTTTREMIHAVLGQKLQGTASPKNYNNQIGLPLSMLRCSPLDDYAVWELGASRPGEIDSLARLCSPQIGVITQIGEAHLEGFGRIETVAQTKAELLHSLPEKGWAVLSGDDPRQRELAEKCRAKTVFVGQSPKCDVVATDVDCRPGAICFTVDRQTFRVRAWGDHHLTSALAAVAVGRIMNLSDQEIAAGLASFRPVVGRSEVLESGGITLINDTYNANPTSMHAALRNLRAIDVPGRRIVVCGDMKELGTAASDAHHRLGAQIVGLAGANLLIACGEFAQTVVESAQQSGMDSANTWTARDADEALKILRDQVGDGDVVLVKGSRVMQMERVIEGMKRSRLQRVA